jgi:hypothetical protein
MKELKQQFKDKCTQLELAGKGGFANNLRLRSCSLEEKLARADEELFGPLADRVKENERKRKAKVTESSRIELRESDKDKERIADAKKFYLAIGLTEFEARQASGEDPYLLECEQHGFGADKVAPYANLRVFNSAAQAAELIRKGFTE